MTAPGSRMLGMGPAPDPVGRAGVRFNDRISDTTRPHGRPGRPGDDQRRTFVLAQRVQAAYQAFRNPSGGPLADTDPTTLDSGTPATARSFAWQEYFRADNTRLQVYEDVREMDETTDEIAAALDILADSSVNPEDGSQHTFVIEIDEGPYRDAAEAIFDQVTESCDLHRQAYSLARSALRDGDVFLELIVDEDHRLARAKQLPPGTIWRNEDESGNLMTGEPVYDPRSGACQNEAGACAFDQRNKMNGQMLAAFYPWQIVHFRWAHRGSDRYGRSMLKTARMAWKKLKACEEALVVARLQRAWMRFVHYVDTSGMTTEAARVELSRYRQELTRRFVLDTQLRENPFEVTSDFYVSSGYIRDLDGAKFLPKLAKIEVLQGDHAVLSAINDIEYLQNKLFASLRVPKAYVGFERDINARNTLSTQDIQFARTLRRVQAVLSQGYKEVFDFALILANIDPAEVHYTVRWPAILVSDEERDAIIRMYHARADAMYWQMGAPSTRYIVQQRYGWDDEAWEADLQMALTDPPARLKVNELRMPNTGDVADAPGNVPEDDLAAQLQQAADAASDQLGLTTDVPPDDYDEAKAATDAEKRATADRRNQQAGTARVRRGNMRQPTSSNTLEEDAFPEELAAQDVLRRAGFALYQPGLSDNRYGDAAHGLGGQPPHLPPLRSRIIVPGLRGGSTPEPRSSSPTYTHEMSVNGVHGRSYLPRAHGRSAPLRATSRQADDAFAEAHDHLGGFVIDLLARKRAASAGS